MLLRAPRQPGRRCAQGGDRGRALRGFAAAAAAPQRRAPRPPLAGGAPAAEGAAAAEQGTAAATPFLDFAWSARSDVAALVAQQEGETWARKLRDLASLSLDLWPPGTPHWRVASSVVVPPLVGAGPSGASKDLAAAISVSGAPGPAAEGRGERRGLNPSDRASCLRMLAALRSDPHAARRVEPLLAALVDKGGVSGSMSGLAYQLPLPEVQSCISALAASGPRRRGLWPEPARRRQTEPAQAAPLVDFVDEGAARLVAVCQTLQLADLLELRSALRRCGAERKEILVELRRRMDMLTRPGTTTQPVCPDPRVETVAVVACAQALGDAAALRTPGLRQALLPAALPAAVAARVLPHALPLEGACRPAHEFVVAMAARQIVSGARTLEVPEIASALRGVLAMQAHGGDFALEYAAKVLRALWPRVALKLPHLDPTELRDALKSYWWQLQCSRQEPPGQGPPRHHPVVDAAAPAQVPTARRGREAAGRAAPEHQAVEDLKAKLLMPALSRLGEGSLKDVAACLTVVAPPVRPPDILSDAERAAVCKAVLATFPAPGGAGQGGARAADAAELAAFRKEFWAGELAALDVAELLELACGLREAGAPAGAWPLEPLLAQLTVRLRPPGRAGRQRQPVELSHFLLLRLCRIMDLWHQHEVESVLQHLLSNPEAVLPLPTPLFVAALEALCRFSVPKEVPLRLVAAFLDRVDRGEREVQGEQWVDLLCSIRPLDEAPSWERATPRIIQHLVPHLEALPPEALAGLLASLASGPIPAADPGVLAAEGVAAGGGWSALETAPAAVLGAVRRTVEAGSWSFEQAIGALDALGRLGWYDDAAVASVLALCMRTPLLEPHAPLLLPLARASAALRVHHAPLMHKMVLWYKWCYTYLRPKPLPTDQLDELLEFSGHLLELSFQSLEMHGVLAENLSNPNATARQVLGLLSLLARFSHFPAEFKDACARVCAEPADADLASLAPSDLVNAFNIHLCAVFDGPAALKYWLTEDETMKSFFQVHTSQKWYQKQDQERTTFLQSDAYLTLKETADAIGVDLRPSDPGEVYNVELVAGDARERLGSRGEPPVALVCVKSREQLRWYVPVTADGTAEAAQPSRNRCHQFRFMFRGAVQKLRHLQAMGYRPAVIWMTEWNRLTSQEERAEYMRAALGATTRRSAAFSPATAEEEDAYR